MVSATAVRVSAVPVSRTTATAVRALMKPFLCARDRAPNSKDEPGGAREPRQQRRRRIEQYTLGHAAVIEPGEQGCLADARAAHHADQTPARGQLTDQRLRHGLDRPF